MRRLRLSVLSSQEIHLYDLLSEYSPEKLTEAMIRYWRDLFSMLAPYNPDVIVLPEIADTPRRGLDRSRWKEYWEARADRFLEFISETAHRLSVYIAHSSVRRLSDGTYRNSTILFAPDGTRHTTYDKVYPTIPELEAGTIPGSGPVIAETPFGKIGFIICFDLNFESLRLKYAKLSPDLIFFSSVYHGSDLKQGMWAYSCQAYLASAISRKGFSNIRNPFGQIIAQTSEYTPFTFADINLDFCIVSLDFNGEKLRELKSKYKSGVEIYEPGKFGEAMIISNSDQPAIDLAKEFDIELLTDYLSRSGSLRDKKICQSAL